MNNILKNTIFVLVIIILVLILLPSISMLFTDNFSNASGYGFNKNFGKLSTMTGLSPIAKATDFKLLSLMSKVKYSFTKPASAYYITETEQGIIPRTNPVNKNIILFPGNTDYILKQNGMEVWPRNVDKIDNKSTCNVYTNNTGHFNAITTLLENIGYVEYDRMNTITYDFRNFDIEIVVTKFKNYLKNNTVIIAYDFGAVLANICINRLSNSEKDKVDKFLLICPTIGGVPMTLRDYFTNSIINSSILENYFSILMSMPHEKMYKKPVAIYDSLSYTANTNSLSKLLQYENKPIELFQKLRILQEESFMNPTVNCVIIASSQYATPMCYDFSNNLKQPPIRYSGLNNNQFPNSDIQYNGTFEGIQTQGDKVIPFSSILELKNQWGNNCKLEIIRDKDHFTILKSYELALIIMSNL